MKLVIPTEESEIRAAIKDREQEDFGIDIRLIRLVSEHERLRLLGRQRRLRHEIRRLRRALPANEQENP